jgi:hypothetical protein
VQHFAATLRRSGLSVKVRKTKGRKIDAACGQLRLTAQRPANAVRLGGASALDLISLDAAAPELLNGSREK